MNKFFAIIISTSVTLAAQADVLDLQSRATLRRHKLEQKNADKSAPRRLISQTAGCTNTAFAEETLAFVNLADDASPADLEEAGIEIMINRGGVLLIKLPYDRAEEIAALPCVKSMRLQKDLRNHTDLARADAGVSAIHAGEQPLDHAYTGKGVLTAIVDQGVDPNHISFLDDNGRNRIGYLSHIGLNASGTQLAINWYGDDVKDAPPVSQFSTDTRSAYHGTHTLGILAGSYKGDVDISAPNASGTADITTCANPYYGVATGSDIGVSCGELQDGFIAYGIDYLYQYGKDYLHEPMVFSLSLGSNTGAHDTSSSMVQMLDMVGKEAIICISSGNEGDLKIALTKTLTADDSKVKSMVYPYAYRHNPEMEEGTLNNYIRYGTISVYSQDDTPFDLKAVIYNRSRGRVAYNMPVVGNNIGTYYCSSTDYQMEETDIVGDTNFKRAFDGYIGVGGKIDEESGRYYGMIDYYVYNNLTTNADDNYILGFEITGVEGQRIECYCDGLTTWIDSYGLAGYDDGSCNGSISDMAVGHNVIVVGSYNTRNVWGTLDNNAWEYEGAGFRPGHISGFSSFGTLADGRNLPTVCGPGAAIMSAISNPYLDYVTEGYDDATAKAYREHICSARATVDGKTYYWKQEVGTSMSTPFVAGSIALWLEADPTLTVDDVKDIIAQTAIRDEVVKSEDPVRWGLGKFNALEGLKEVIRRADAGVEAVASDSHNSRLIVTPTGQRSFNIFLGEASSLDIRLYGAWGAPVFSRSYQGDEAELDLSSLHAGIYVLSVNGSEARKIILK